MKNQKINTMLIMKTLLLLIAVFMFSTAESQLTKKWETEPIFLAPESVVYDAVRNCLYVSNFNDKGGFLKNDDKVFDECISKLDLNGNAQDFRWLDSLHCPTGITIFKDKLYIVEREGLSIGNIDKRKIEQRIPISDAGFLNDIVIDKNGIVYISDSSKGRIYRIENGKSEMWCSDSLLNSSNGLFIDHNKLLVGNKGSVNLISISLKDKTTEVIAKDVSVNIDGIRKLKKNYLVSWRSELFMLEPGGKKTLLFKLDDTNDFLADFEFIKKDKLLIIPTLISNKVTAFKIEP